MDLNYLYYRQGTSLMMAKAASSSCARMAHNEMARLYAMRIEDARPLARPASYWTSWADYRWVPGETFPLPAAVIAA